MYTERHSLTFEDKITQFVNMPLKSIKEIKFS